ncbi:arylamine N-acetyltransferase family protein [Gordonia soli]|uniref:Arylamine N-acetyltransferase n=1 Tax=Gordonia soli NBRC 108243 TaxID=1223545 RepID=M0QIY9_9ACTN|nr:arylamine N-acetyltransferase [Gordonia soli]GAC68600.1 arylamine N-acetyltransferase [Gordonia soli NBRC 108243]
MSPREDLVEPTESAIDLDAYLARIGHREPVAPTAETLRTVVEAHTRTIPFENIDPLLGVPVADLGVDALTDKLVRRRRGGFCYEHNGLMRYVLDEIGFGVRHLGGRVVWMLDDDAPLPARTHNVLAVTVPDSDDEYLVDVGFGGQTLPSPIRFVIDEEQSTRLEPYRISSFGNGLALEALIRDTWRPLYHFSPDTVPRIDREVGSWYVSTHPRSVFVVGLTAALVAEDERWNLRGRNVSVHHRDGTSTKKRLDSAAEVVELLEDRFGIDVATLDGLEKRVNEVLDS